MSYNGVTPLSFNEMSVYAYKSFWADNKARPKYPEQEKQTQEPELDKPTSRNVLARILDP